MPACLANKFLIVMITAHAGSAVVRIDPLHFLAVCRKRQLSQALSFSQYSFLCVLFIRATFCVLLVYADMCYVFWLF